MEQNTAWLLQAAVQVFVEAQAVEVRVAERSRRGVVQNHVEVVSRVLC